MLLFRPDLHVLTGAYAVDAVDDEAELARFEHHLRRCQQCSGEVRGLTEATTRLAFAAALEPPTTMRRRVLALVARTRQVPPVVDRRTSVWHLAPGRAPWVARTVAVAAVAVAIALTVVLLRAQSQLDQARSKLAQARSRIEQTTSRQAALAAVLAAPDARARTERIQVGGTATVVYSLRLHSLIVTSAGLPPAPTGKVYELWLIGPPQIRSAGFLAAPATGRSAPALVLGLRLGDKLGLTIEPAGGTRQPTTKPVLLVGLPN